MQLIILRRSFPHEEHKSNEMEKLNSNDSSKMQLLIGIEERYLLCFTMLSNKKTSQNQNTIFYKDHKIFVFFLQL